MGFNTGDFHDQTSLGEKAEKVLNRF